MDRINNFMSKEFSKKCLEVAERIKGHKEEVLVYLKSMDPEIFVKKVCLHKGRPFCPFTNEEYFKQEKMLKWIQEGDNWKKFFDDKREFLGFVGATKNYMEKIKPVVAVEVEDEGEKLWFGVECPFYNYSFCVLRKMYNEDQSEEEEVDF